jgi:hypothetical protein
VWTYSPTFTSALTTQVVAVLKTSTYVLPGTSDQDNDVVTISLSSPPAWVTLAGSTVTISPLKANLGLTYSVIVQLDDGYSATVKYTLTVQVLPNSAPFFATTLTDKTVVALTTTDYALPAMMDNELDTVTA